MNTPVAIFIYKRSTNLKRLLKSIRQVKPKILFIISDGPINKQERELVYQTRQELESQINWSCQIYKNYAKENQGLKERFRTGIDWVFEHSDKAIFIEDDCLPDPTFFRYCDELLAKYKNNTRVMTISGNNFLYGKNISRDSYYFSKYPHVWGWATWKRAWTQYDSDISDWQDRRNTKWLEYATKGPLISKFWKYTFDRLSQGKINTWDYQLTYMSFKHSGLNIIPSVNLVTNVGYGQDATNLKHQNKTIGVPSVPMRFPLVHPRKLTINHQADKFVENLVYLHPLGKLSLFIKSILGVI